MASEETGTMDMAQMVQVLLEDWQKRDQELAGSEKRKMLNARRRFAKNADDVRKRWLNMRRRSVKNVEDVTKKRLSRKKKLECKWSYFEVFLKECRDKEKPR